MRVEIHSCISTIGIQLFSLCYLELNDLVRENLMSSFLYAQAHLTAVKQACRAKGVRADKEIVVQVYGRVHEDIDWQCTS